MADRKTFDVLFDDPKMSDAQWSRNLFDMLADGGTWGTKRSGLIFVKRAPDRLVLRAVMPWMSEMEQAAKAGHDVPPSKEKLIEYQLSDFDVIKDRFGIAGIKVEGRERIT